jgi:glyoxylase-like metal-dependent hydrolase (beta-lactamase superfamily II)
LSSFTEVARDVYVLRYPRFDVNATLVVGDGAALLVDTLSSPAEATELAAAARKVTPAPWTIVNTHHHFDHCLGNGTLAPAQIWAHAATAAVLGSMEGAPTDIVHASATLDVGGRPVVLHHLGRGHTEGDLVVQVPDADALVAGDLVEESGPPSFEDSYPLEWPETLAALLRLCGPSTVAIPGHGAVVGRDFVTAQHADLVRLEWLIRDGDADGSPPDRVAARAPFGPQVTLPAIRRGYLQLRSPR